jgi:peptide/nickel transport system permease protein
MTITLSDAVEATVAEDVATRRRRPIAAIAAAAFVVVCIVTALLASVLAPYDPERQRITDALLPPGSSGSAGYHLLGTDELGRDVLSRLIYGVRPLLVIVAVSVTLAALFGLLWGLLAGTTQRTLSTVMMRLADMQLAIPPVVIAVMLAVILDPGITTSIVAISIVTWPQYARIVRAEALRVRSSDYVSLARVAGLSRPQVLRHHVLPNVMNSYVVLCTLNLAIAIIFASALSFLGVGVQAPTPDWGNMLAGGTQYLDSWWLVTIPGIAITLLVLSLNVIGDHVRDRLDPRLAVL